MIALTIALAGFVLIACGVSGKRREGRIVAEVLAVEQRQIARDRSALNRAAFGALGKEANR